MCASYRSSLAEAPPRAKKLVTVRLVEPPARRISLPSASAPPEVDPDDGPCAALHRVWSITRTTRFMRSLGCQRRASVSVIGGLAALLHDRPRVDRMGTAVGTAGGSLLMRPRETKEASGFLVAVPDD